MRGWGICTPRIGSGARPPDNTLSVRCGLEPPSQSVASSGTRTGADGKIYVGIGILSGEETPMAAVRTPPLMTDTTDS